MPNESSPTFIPHFLKIHFNTSPSTPFLSVLQFKFCTYFPATSCVLMPHPSHLPWLVHCNKWWTEQITKLLIKQFSSTSCYLLLGPCILLSSMSLSTSTLAHFVAFLNVLPWVIQQSPYISAECGYTDIRDDMCFPLRPSYYFWNLAETSTACPRVQCKVYDYKTPSICPSPLSLFLTNVLKI
jgi:hypothetical protein